MTNLSQEKQEYRQQLTGQLSSLLGFEDGVDDVLDHLLLIDTSKDLIEYLTSLLGNHDPHNLLKRLADDIGKYQRNEPLEISSIASPTTKGAAAPQLNPSSSPSVRNSISSERSVSTSTNKNKDFSSSSSSQQLSSRTKNTHETNIVTTDEKKILNLNSNKKNVNSAQNKNLNKKNLKSNGKRPETTKEIPSKTARPEKQRLEKPVQLTGYPKSLINNNNAINMPSLTNQQQQQPVQVCGCFGLTHPAVTNCLHCGYILCSVEFNNNKNPNSIPNDSSSDCPCPFCQNLVSPVQEPALQSEDKVLMAWNEKERLLQYDREHAQRTIVLDDQEDFFVTEGSAWLTEEERQVAHEMEQKHSDMISKRQHIQLNLDL